MYVMSTLSSAISQINFSLLRYSVSCHNHSTVVVPLLQCITEQQKLTQALGPVSVFFLLSADMFSTSTETQMSYAVDNLVCPVCELWLNGVS